MKKKQELGLYSQRDNVSTSLCKFCLCLFLMIECYDFNPMAYKTKAHQC